MRRGRGGVTVNYECRKGPRPPRPPVVQGEGVGVWPNGIPPPPWPLEDPLLVPTFPGKSLWADWASGDLQVEDPLVDRIVVLLYADAVTWMACREGRSHGPPPGKGWWPLLMRCKPLAKSGPHRCVRSCRAAGRSAAAEWWHSALQSIAVWALRCVGATTCRRWSGPTQRLWCIFVSGGKLIDASDCQEGSSF